MRFITPVLCKPSGLEAAQQKRKIVVDSDDKYDLAESRHVQSQHGGIQRSCSSHHTLLGTFFLLLLERS